MIKLMTMPKKSLPCKNVAFSNVDTLTRSLRALASRRKKSVMAILDSLSPEAQTALNRMAAKDTPISEKDVMEVVGK